VASGCPGTTTTAPTVVISGGRDLTTPRAVAERIVELIPAAVLVDMPSSGHGIIDTKERSALDVVTAVYAGETAELPSRSAQLDVASSLLSVRLLVGAITAASAAESVVPSAVPRAVRHVTTS
jgi:hypothetical protein